MNQPSPPGQAEPARVNQLATEGEVLYNWHAQFELELSTVTQIKLRMSEISLHSAFPSILWQLGDRLDQLGDGAGDDHYDSQLLLQQPKMLHSLTGTSRLRDAF